MKASVSVSQGLSANTVGKSNGRGRCSAQHVGPFCLLPHSPFLGNPVSCPLHACSLYFFKKTQKWFSRTPSSLPGLPLRSHLIWALSLHCNMCSVGDMVTATKAGSKLSNSREGPEASERQQVFENAPLPFVAKAT